MRLAEGQIERAERRLNLRGLMVLKQKAELTAHTADDRQCLPNVQPQPTGPSRQKANQDLVNIC